MHKITGLSHSGFDVEDLGRTAEFYQRVLGAELKWRADTEKVSAIKLYVGDLGLSVLERKPGQPKAEIPHAIHFAYKVAPEEAEDCINHIKSCGVEVEGPVGHVREPENVSWFFLDPDDYRLEIEAHYHTAEEAADVVARGEHDRREHMGLYGGDPVLKTQKS
jgi:catechol 2,3-dioxygenase-like lactoylglutathione lyase family enzyme